MATKLEDISEIQKLQQTNISYHDAHPVPSFHLAYLIYQISSSEIIMKKKQGDAVEALTRLRKGIFFLRARQ